MFYGSSEFIRDNLKPLSFLLGNNYPNPFTNETIIPFSLPEGNDKYAIELSVYDLLGKKVQSLTHGDYEPGHYQIAWDPGRNQEHIDPGMYLYKLEINSLTLNKVFTKKLVLK